ncbi:MAG: RNA-binding transcriptional accessory protein [Ruminococcus sp.]|nr:Tex family protein [uncultured Ruminococcus sp.]MBQ1594135.1 RNA-binding transcriptional accessory protein [Ruminococcus sp.]MDO4892116.1 Tex family protein [Eubacteriales bacterium]
MEYSKVLAQQFEIREEYAANIIALLDDGNTIPFIARYRKEMHGSMDDQLIRQFSEKLDYLRGLDKRREEIRNLIEAQEKLTDEVAAALEKAQTLSELEDIYRPFRPKRKTRASVAKEKGLEPLAVEIIKQEKGFSPQKYAEEFVSEEKGVASADEALAGAMDIIAEQVSDSAEIRKRIREIAQNNGVLRSVAADEEKESVYTMYYDFGEAVKKIAGHRVLAVNRGEKEGFLKVSLELDEERPLSVIYRLLDKGRNPLCSDILRAAGEDAYSRLIFPSIEREIRSELTDNAAENAMKVFAVNLKQLLMQPPVKGKVVLGLDPGYRTGCKVAVVDGTGKVLDTAVIYPTHGERKAAESKAKLLQLIKKHRVDIISIGNGTASKETEMFAADAIKEIERPVYYMVVSEAGASVYSASKLAATELPELDLTLRSAVSIARRLQDPLAELVKIEPKAIGVGQYQHDMPQKRLGETLDGVVEDCVNSVGADLNTASPALLLRVSGLNSTVCKNIVAYREENGAFSSRAELKKVPKLGPKAFEQCAGFLRVPESRNPLDNTGVHPESYKSAKELLGLLDYSDKEIKAAKFTDISGRVKAKGTKTLADTLGIGLPTLDDIVKELSKPGRDPRDEMPAPMLRTDVLDINDLKEGMELKGTVRNVIDFGAFVDIGVHQDGLVHISQICDKFIKHPSEVLKVGDVVNVKILSVDPKKNRISLTMRF